MITVAIQCPFCGSYHEVEVDVEQYLAWQNGELIQNAMPNLSATEREQLISGICPKCQREIFRIIENLFFL
jgi:Zn finger protein HypA/HybF involved in hydrogenase expression